MIKERLQPQLKSWNGLGLPEPKWDLSWRIITANDEIISAIVQPGVFKPSIKETVDKHKIKTLKIIGTSNSVSVELFSCEWIIIKSFANIVIQRYGDFGTVFIGVVILMKDGRKINIFRNGFISEERS